MYVCIYVYRACVFVCTTCMCVRMCTYTYVTFLKEKTVYCNDLTAPSKLFGKVLHTYMNGTYIHISMHCPAQRKISCTHVGKYVSSAVFSSKPSFFMIAKRSCERASANCRNCSLVICVCMYVCMYE